VAGAFKRASDRARGKAGKYTGWYFDELRRKRRFTGTTDKQATLEIARAREAECRLIREGLIDPRARSSREAAGRPVASHVDEYRDHILAGGATAKHAGHTRGVLLRLLASAAIESTADLRAEAIVDALGRLRARRSARTANHAAVAVRAFVAWLADGDRIAGPLKGLSKIRPFNEDADRRRVRRALSVAELAKLLAATEAAPPIVAHRKGRGGKPIGHLTGPDRAMLYRLAMGTGFRANELRSLTPESFRLDGDAPTVTVAAAYSKNGREAVQPITADLAARLRPWLEGREPGRPVLPVPEKTAEMLAADLARAGIPVETADGVVDFHALRTSYVTSLIQAGVDVKTVQMLARHSTPTLTIARYARTDDGRKREAIEKLGGGEGA
jgi:integrase